MKKYEELHALIRSLTANEKRNFKIMTDVIGQNSNYTKLFDAIDKQQHYNEADIKSHFKDQTFAFRFFIQLQCERTNRRILVSEREASLFFVWCDQIKFLEIDNVPPA